MTVTWRASAGTLSDSIVTTNANGYAEVRWTLGTASGPQQIVARASGLASAPFIVTAAPGPPVSVVITPASIVAEPGAVVQYTADVGPDQYGNPQSAPVVWTTSDSAVAPVTSGGQVTAGRAGKAALRATVAGVADTSVIAVAAHWRAIGAGRFHTCALDQLGYAFCWGDNSEGQLGVPDRSADSVPVAVADGRRYTALAVGSYHACATTSTNEAFCWGQNGVGQLGIGTFAIVSSATPRRVFGATPFAAIATTTGIHTCGLHTLSGAAYCWGWEGEGQLGNGKFLTFVGQHSPVAVEGGLTFRAISAGGSHTCAITHDDVPYCWGNDYEGQVGDSSITEPRYRPVPTAVIGDTRVRSIVTGGAHTCASTLDDRILCWGSSESGQVGDGTYIAHLTPTAIGPPSFTAIAAGYRHTCGLTAEGEVWCWGLNDDGQLGGGSTLTKPLPTRVNTTVRFRSLAGGWAHTCGLTDNGDAYCWGAGESGELGIGTRGQRGAPTRVVDPR